MIQVRFIKENNDYKRFIINGHADYADKGEDIVCAAVSALVINTINSVEQFTKDNFSCDCKEGAIQGWEFPADVSYETNLFMDSLLLGLENIRKSYGDQYLQIFLDTGKMS